MTNAYKCDLCNKKKGEKLVNIESNILSGWVKPSSPRYLTHSWVWKLGKLPTYYHWWETCNFELYGKRNPEPRPWTWKIYSRRKILRKDTFMNSDMQKSQDLTTFDVYEFHLCTNITVALYLWMQIL